MIRSHDNAYAVYPRAGSPLIPEHSVLGGLWRWLRWVAALCVVVLLIDLFFVIVIWDDGTQALVGLVATERQILGVDSSSVAGRFVDTTVTEAHEWVFVKTGLDNWLTTQRSGLLAALIDELWVLVDTALLGLQLFAMRLAVLILSLPLFVLVGTTAVADGLYGWLMRRTGGGRESGFIYHRAKRAVPVFLLLVWAVYVIPPHPIDPRWVIPPFVVLFGIALRLRVSYFKKYI